ncbi:helix-turn-helix domain-containing protein [Tahibacter amnicola]|uniref:CRP-like protein Clp n=1 Tax=Tahibacter amnicola TaxID=2976241 RepID=A0ABY6B9S7_9GAMM|nr:helix-turn-helix domain-containing protein [Tahibacter amnicola]UXI66307.1 helix-turn-helix domain-containing protein [Tahibacter amnicola]
MRPTAAHTSSRQWLAEGPAAVRAMPSGQQVLALCEALGLERRRVRRRQYVFRSGQPLHALFLVHCGLFKTVVVNEDGCESITGFAERGDLLGADGLSGASYGCDAQALDMSYLWELPADRFDTVEAQLPGFWQRMAVLMAGQIQHDNRWRLQLGHYNAEQRVAAFLLELSECQRAQGCSADTLLLRMTRADIGNYLALQLETVTRVLSRLHALGLIQVARRNVRLAEPDALRMLLRIPRAWH